MSERCGQTNRPPNQQTFAFLESLLVSLDGTKNKILKNGPKTGAVNETSAYLIIDSSYRLKTLKETVFSDHPVLDVDEVF